MKNKLYLVGGSSGVLSIVAVFIIYSLNYEKHFEFNIGTRYTTTTNAQFKTFFMFGFRGVTVYQVNSDLQEAV